MCAPMQRYQSALIEQYCLETIEHLALGDQTKAAVKEDAELMAMLRELEVSGENRKIVRGALFVLEEAAARPGYSEQPADGGKHIMVSTYRQGVIAGIMTMCTQISYNWAHQEVVVKIADQLKSKGFRVWLDVDQMVCCVHPMRGPCPHSMSKLTWHGPISGWLHGRQHGSSSGAG